MAFGCQVWPAQKLDFIAMGYVLVMARRAPNKFQFFEFQRKRVAKQV
jgi:hypothetical protein